MISIMLFMAGLMWYYYTITCICIKLHQNNKHHPKYPVFCPRYITQDWILDNYIREGYFRVAIPFPLMARGTEVEPTSVSLLFSVIDSIACPISSSQNCLIIMHACIYIMPYQLAHARFFVCMHACINTQVCKKNNFVNDSMMCMVCAA